MTFDIGKAVQAGLTFLARNIVSIATKNVVLLAVFGLALVILAVMLEDAIVTVLIGYLLENLSFLDVLWLIVILVVALMVRMAVVGILITRFHIMATGDEPGPWAVRFGDETAPLFGIRKDEATAARAFALTAWALWPFLISFIAFAVSDLLAFRAEFAELSGESGTGFSLLSAIFWLLGWAMILFGLSNVIRRFFYAVPVIREGGVADWAIIKRFVPGGYPLVLSSPVFWRHAAVVFLCWLPLIAISWLGTMAIEATRDGAGDPGSSFVVFLAAVFEFVGLAVSTAIFAGALAEIAPLVKVEPGTTDEDDDVPSEPDRT